MDVDYYKITSNIDPREVLRYLNNMGIRNVSAEILKCFITDLKKYIKYDLQLKYQSLDQFKENNDVPGLERLHSASTFSSRNRSKVQDGHVLKCTRECQKERKPLQVLKTQSAPNVGQQKIEEKPMRRACSCVRIDKKSETNPSKATITTSNNIIRVAKQPTIKKCDPVSLYQYYTEMWEKYKSNLPGENNWSELRWNVRRKMAGQVDQTHKVPHLKLKNKENID